MPKEEISRLDRRFALLISAAVLAYYGLAGYFLYIYVARPDPTHNPAGPFVSVLGMIAFLGFARQAAFLIGSMLLEKSRGLYFDDGSLIFISPLFRSARIDEITEVKIYWAGRKRDVKWEYISIERRNKRPVRFLARLLDRPSGQVVQLCQSHLAGAGRA